MNINLITAINTLSYGYVGIHITEELLKLGHDVALFPIGQIECHFRHEKYIRQALINADKFKIDSPCIRIWHQHDMSMFVGHGPHIGFPIFELNTFTEKERHHLGSCDELMVCSKWALNVSAVNLFDIDKYKPIKVVPLGVDNDIFVPRSNSRKSTIFLNVGKWEIRKGHDILLKAFQVAFPMNDNVELWMMPDNKFPHAQNQVNQFVKEYNKDRRIRILPRVESDIQVAEIMQQADCGVFPSRAEGFNLPALEMLSCGKHVIATDYSAHTEYLNKDNSLLLQINELETAYDGVWFNGQGEWAKLDNFVFDQLVDYMRFIHDKKQSNNLNFNESGIETAKKFTWKNTASNIVKFLGDC